MGTILCEFRQAVVCLSLSKDPGTEVHRCRRADWNVLRPVCVWVKPSSGNAEIYGRRDFGSWCLDCA